MNSSIHDILLAASEILKEAEVSSHARRLLRLIALSLFNRGL